jgi:hypothetical protein
MLGRGGERGKVSCYGKGREGQRREEGGEREKRRALSHQLK